MLDIALKNLWARKSRTALVVLGVVVCVFLINTVDGMLSEMNNSLKGDMARVAGKIYLRQSGSGYPPFASSLSEATAREALTTPGVDADESTPVLLLSLVPADNPMDLAEVIGVGVTPGKERAYLDQVTASAGVITLEGAPANAVILGINAADYYGAAVGDTVDINGEVGQVAGILARRRIGSIDQAALMPLQFAQNAFSKEGLVSFALLTIEDPGQTQTVASALAGMFPRFEVATDADIRDEASKMLDMPNRFMGMISWTVFLAAIVMVTNVMLIAVRERTREIGTLAALGVRPGTVMLTVLYEALILTAAGGVLGIVLTVPAAYAADWAWILSYQEVVKVAFLVLIAGGLAALYPAYRATRVSPVEALRYE